MKKVILLLIFLSSLFSSLFLFLPSSLDKKLLIDLILNIRLYEAASAIIVGISLSISGLIFQNVLRNDLADPYVIGVSGGSVFGVTLCMVFLGSYGSIFFFRALSSFLIGLITLFIVIRISNGVPEKLLLVGVLLNIAFGSLSKLFVLYLKPFEITNINSILAGFISPLTKAETIFSFSVMAFALLTISFYFKEADILYLSDDEALSVGVDVKKVRIILIISASILSANAVAISGMIGFIGLIVPHISRIFTKPSFINLFFISLPIGSSIILLSQLLTKIPSLNASIPVGLYINFVGIVFFIVLFIKKGISNGS